MRASSRSSSFCLSCVPFQSLPDPETLLRDIRANQTKMDAIRENYTFRRIRIEEDLDDKGKVVKTTTMEREVFFVHGRQIGRLVKKDGIPLNASEEKSEQARVKKIVETAMKDTAPRRGRGQISFVSQILPLMIVSNPRRITFRGRPTLAYDFTGDPDAKVKDKAENAAKKMAGTIWFDEAEHQVARIEVHFYDKFRMGGFLASVQKGTSFEMEHSPIGDGLWMQNANDQHFDVRIVVKNFRPECPVNIKDSDFQEIQRRSPVKITRQAKRPRYFVYFLARRTIVLMLR